MAPAPMTLAEARSLFQAADLDRDGVLKQSEIGGAALSEADRKLADRDGDGALRSDEFLGALPLLLVRTGRRASPELEAEAIRLRTLAAPAPARSAPGVAPPSSPTDGAARGRLVSAVRSQSENAVPAPVARPRSDLNATGPAGARLRTTPTAAEAEARLQAARVSLAERLRHDQAGLGAAPTTPDPTSLSGRRRRTQSAEPNEPSVSAERLRAARQKLDERIRRARDAEAEGPPTPTTPEKQSTPVDPAVEPARPRPVEPPGAEAAPESGARNGPAGGESAQDAAPTPHPPTEPKPPSAP